MNTAPLLLALCLGGGPLLLALGLMNLRPNPFDRSIPPLELMTDRLLRSRSAPPRVKWHRRPARQRGWAAIGVGAALTLAGATMLLLLLGAEQQL